MQKYIPFVIESCMYLDRYLMCTPRGKLGDPFHSEDPKHTCYTWTLWAFVSDVLALACKGKITMYFSASYVLTDFGFNKTVSLRTRSQIFPLSNPLSFPTYCPA